MELASFLGRVFDCEQASAALVVSWIGLDLEYPMTKPAGSEPGEQRPCWACDIVRQLMSSVGRRSAVQSILIFGDIP